MRLNVKLLNGSTFPIEFDPEITVADLKREIEVLRPDLTASGQVLIHNGNILKDNVAISKCGVNEDSFIVCMIKKKNTQSTTSAAPTSVSVTTPIQPRVTVSTPPAPSNPSTSPPIPLPQSTVTPVNQRPTTTPAPAPIPSSTVPLNPFTTHTRSTPQQPPALDNNIIQQLSSMGFPESEARAALQAARGNPDLAIDFLFNGIPDSFYQQQQQQQQQQTGMFAPRTALETPSTTVPPSTRTQSGPLEMLRQHPQINTLRAMFQQNPSLIPVLLNQIGQSSPDLLAAIHQNREEFIRILNEPINTTSTTPTQPPQVPSQSSSLPPAQMQQIAAMQASFAQQIQMLPPEQQQGFAAMLNLTPEQLSKFITDMPPEEFMRFMNMTLGGMGGMGGMPGMGGAPPVLRFTQEESEAIRRLMELGFDQAEVIQAYVACDKNETLAANFLYDGMTESLGYGVPFGGQVPLQTVPSSQPPTTTSTNQPSSSSTTTSTNQPSSSSSSTTTTTTTTNTSTQENTEQKSKEENNQQQQPPKDDDDMYS